MRKRYLSNSSSESHHKQSKHKHQDHREKNKSHHHHHEIHRYKSKHHKQSGDGHRSKRSREKHRDDRRKKSKEHQQKYQIKYEEEGMLKNKVKSEDKQRESFQEDKVEIVKQLPCWQPSGILLKYYNSRDGISLKFHEPPQARSPIEGWRFYIFKGEQVLQPIVLVNSVYLIGKDERICDILCENPSISRQHAVIQFRSNQSMTTEGDYIETIKPYIMDLESTNGTLLNEQKIESTRYYELLHKDVLHFGFSDREYVIVKDQPEENQPDYQEQ